MLDAGNDKELEAFLEFFHKRFYYDFSGYSMSSVRRRVTQVCDYTKCASLPELTQKLSASPNLAEKVMEMLTVQVSEMFRDPEYFKAIRTQVVPYLRTYPSIKLWVAGCSSGEELYSFAILFKEEGLFDRTIFYATDINRSNLQKAHNGIYDLDRAPLFANNYAMSGGTKSFADYYKSEKKHILMSEELRSKTVFSEHNLVVDGVFSEMHLISCRNVLIYFDRMLQDRVINLFAESLVHKGFLGLGMRERIHFSKHASRFSDFSYDSRIFQLKTSE